MLNFLKGLFFSRQKVEDTGVPYKIEEPVKPVEQVQEVKNVKVKVESVVKTEKPKSTKAKASVKKQNPTTQVSTKEKKPKLKRTK